SARAPSTISALSRALPFTSPLPVVFLAIWHLLQFLVGDRRLDLVLAQPQPGAALLAQVLELVVVDVVPVALGEAVEEHRPRAGPERDDRAEAAALALALAGHALLDEAAAQIGIDQALADIAHRLGQGRIVDPLPPLKPRERLALEHPHPDPLCVTMPHLGIDCKSPNRPATWRMAAPSG